MNEVRCSVCDAKIPKARLAAVPGTEFCVKCADKYGPSVDIDVDAIVDHADYDDFEIG